MPSLDGFQPLFHKSFWYIIKEDIIATILDVFKEAKMSNSWKLTYIVLIPKVSNSKEVKYYRPIILCGTLYKFITKVLVNKLKYFMPSLVSMEHGALVL